VIVEGVSSGNWSYWTYLLWGQKYQITTAVPALQGTLHMKMIIWAETCSEKLSLRSLKSGLLVRPCVSGTLARCATARCSIILRNAVNLRTMWLCASAMASIECDHCDACECRTVCNTALQHVLLVSKIHHIYSYNVDIIFFNRTDKVYFIGISKPKSVNSRAIFRFLSPHTLL
jgi:hypothetical protein